MFVIENKLTYNVSVQNTDQALENYNELLKLLEMNKISTDTRKLKNYLISLVSSLTRAIHSRPLCKRSLYLYRLDMVDKIEGTNTNEDLIQLGRDIVTYLSKLIGKEDKGCPHPVMRQALNFIHNNLSEDLSLDTVSSAIYISRNYLSNLFSTYIGKSFSTYINELRVEKAKVLLRNPDISLTDIALECGFNSQSYFCYIFKKIEKVTPKQYRSIS